MGIQLQKSRKITIFGINLPLWKNFWGPQKNLSSCTTTNLPACNDTITVLIIILLYSVSVITNFVIPKRDKQTNRQTKLEINMHHICEAMQYQQATCSSDFTKSCVIEGFVTQEAKNVPKIFLIFFPKFCRRFCARESEIGLPIRNN